MKKFFIPLAALGAFAGAASAQSSVTLFGIVDVGARAVKNGDGSTVKSLTSNGLATSRLGFRAVEDLGDGLKAGFWLESEVASDTGTAGSSAGTFANSTATSNAKFFNRRATVGLTGPFGEVRLGRDYTPTYSNLAAFDSYGAVGVGSIKNVIGLTSTRSFSSSTGCPRIALSKCMTGCKRTRPTWSFSTCRRTRRR
jgi:predicted porin